VNNPAQKKLEELCIAVVAARSGKVPDLMAASTDCNIPLSIGIPAVTVGLCMGGLAHTRQEWIELKSLEPGFAIAADLILNCCEE
jgi:acetylornithine deacetylase/succinyl-diaminopimelate desuccinylase-like protein